MRILYNCFFIFISLSIQCWFKILPIGAFVCHRQDTPRTNTIQPSPPMQFKRIRTLQLFGHWSRSSLGFGVQRYKCCAGNILVDSSSPQPQDAGAMQPLYGHIGRPCCHGPGLWTDSSWSSWSYVAAWHQRHHESCWLIQAEACGTVEPWPVAEGDW